jgi:hypothetical protein
MKELLRIWPVMFLLAFLPSIVTAADIAQILKIDNLFDRNQATYQLGEQQKPDQLIESIASLPQFDSDANTINLYRVFYLAYGSQQPVAAIAKLVTNWWLLTLWPHWSEFLNWTNWTCVNIYQCWSTLWLNNARPARAKIFTIKAD